MNKLSIVRQVFTTNQLVNDVSTTTPAGTRIINETWMLEGVSPLPKDS